MTEREIPDWVLIESAKRVESNSDLNTLRCSYGELPTFRALCDMIQKHEQPPVDRKLLCAREAMYEVQNSAARNVKGIQIFTAIDVAIRAIELYEQGFGQ